MRLQKIGLNPTLLAGLIVLTVVVLVAIGAPLLTTYDPIAQQLDDAFKPPLSPNHLLGTDNFGRDIWSRILYGARLDLEIAAVSVVFPFVFGTFVGITTGYLGGYVDTLFMRVLDVMMAFPFLVLVVAIMAVLGPGLLSMYIAFGLVGWIPYARITRGETLATRNLEYIQAARTIGAATPRVMVRHVLPNTIGPGLVYVFTGMVLAILVGSALSYLGLGPQPPTPEWGAMIAAGRQYMLQAWWITALPGLALLVLGVGLSLIGDGLADKR
ncbi:MAG: ABC transporter permease [Chloroflexi bacterium]|nr:ABC transporter permease [Chloroflexota bacterium]